MIGHSDCSEYRQFTLNLNNFINYKNQKEKIILWIKFSMCVCVNNNSNRGKKFKHVRNNQLTIRILRENICKLKIFTLIYPNLIFKFFFSGTKIPLSAKKGPRSLAIFSIQFYLVFLIAVLYDTRQISNLECLNSPVSE